MAPGGSDGSLAGSAGERDHHAHPTVYAVFSDLLSLALARFLRQTDVKPLGYLGAFVVVAGAMYSAIGHRIWSGLRKHTTVVSQPRAGE